MAEEFGAALLILLVLGLFKIVWAVLTGIVGAVGGRRELSEEEMLAVPEPEEEVAARPPPLPVWRKRRAVNLVPLPRVAAAVPPSEDSKPVPAVSEALELANAEPTVTRYRHSAFGAGTLLRRQHNGLWIRFDDGIERLIVERFLTPF